MIGHVALAFIFLALFFLLGVYFAYTLIAIFKGAAYVPTTHSRVARLIELAALSPGERLLDLGSGDGRILFAAAQRGAVCIGIEINPLLCWYSSFLAKVKRAKNVSIQRTNFWDFSLAEVDVLTVYLVPMHLEALRVKVLAEMRSGSRVITAVHHFPDWAPEGRNGDVCLYRVP
jgi:SAM-dependent methyltransferase